MTGVTSYIGTNLAGYLLDHGYHVHAIVRPESKINQLDGIKHRLKMYEFNGQTSQLVCIMNQIRPSAVIHLASLFIAEHTPEDVDAIIKSNILFGTKLLDAAVASGVLYFINTGSYWQNYNGDAYNPANLYAASKQAFECISKFYRGISQMRMLTVKLTDTYGPFDPRPKLMNLLKKIAISGEILDMSPGEQELGLLYIDDVVKGYIKAIDLIQEMKPSEHKTYMLSPDKYYKLREVAQIFERVSGKKLNILWGKRAYRQREVMKITGIEPCILGGTKVVDLPEGISRMLEKEGFYKQNLRGRDHDVL